MRAVWLCSSLSRMYLDYEVIPQDQLSGLLDSIVDGSQREAATRFMSDYAGYYIYSSTTKSSANYGITHPL